MPLRSTTMNRPCYRDFPSRVLTIIMLVLSGCASTHPSGDAATGPSNASYVIEGRNVRLVAGHLEAEAAPGSAAKVRTDIVGTIAYGDIDGDRDEDAVVILSHDPGGSGVFYYAAAAQRDGSTFSGTPAFLLGDRIVVERVSIRDGVVTVDYRDRREGEPMSAVPTLGKSAQLVFREGTLMPAETFAGGGSNGSVGGPVLLSVTGVEWRLLRFTWDGANYLLSIDQVPTFTIDAWGKVNGSGSINRYAGEMTVDDGGRFTWRGQIAGTRMAGPRPLMDQEQAFLLALQQADRMSLRNDHLVIEDATGRNVLEFER